MSNRVNIFLQHTCGYTREGLKSLLLELSEEFPINIVAEDKQLQSNVSQLMLKPGVDFFILGLQSDGNNASEILSFIIKTVPSSFPDAKVIIMTQLNSMGGLKDYILGLNNVYAIIDNGSTLKEMRNHLIGVLNFSVDLSPRTFKLLVAPLTHRELSVLGFLLKGKSPDEVAHKLCINYKTVSSHKQSALHKLGIRSLNGLLTSGNNRELMYQLLHHRV
ncbi:helix-turn-helix domain-containing protein [Serratia aquatilis]|uniref:Helix-turn-helix transcriptional regulator n=1 Tax=Serratia aquatilis TaxID=1737515 RepID=A0ABV6EAZ4_9GAMM